MIKDTDNYIVPLKEYARGKIMQKQFSVDQGCRKITFPVDLIEAIDGSSFYVVVFDSQTEGQEAYNFVIFVPSKFPRAERLGGIIYNEDRRCGLFKFVQWWDGFDNVFVCKGRELINYYNCAIEYEKMYHVSPMFLSLFSNRLLNDMDSAINDPGDVDY